MTDDQRWRGFIDYIDEPLLTGWAFDTHYPDLPLLVQVSAASGKTEIVRANIFRQDLKDHGIGDGRHGFVADLQNFSTLDGAIEISILGGDCVLAENIHLETLNLRNAVPPVPGTFLALMRLTAAESRITAVSAAQSGAGQPCSFEEAQPPFSGRSLAVILMDTASPERDPEGLISKFLRFEVIRSGGKHLKAKLSGTTKDRLNVLLWYIGEYTLRWGRSLSIPLSPSQIRFLNAPLPVDEFPESISVALWNLLRRDRPDLLDITKPVVEHEALYWWCIEKTPQLNLERRLVTPEQAAVLRRVEKGPYTRFPLSIFMRLHIAKHRELQCLNLHSAAGRLAALHYFILLSLKHPHIIDFLPIQSLQLLFATQADGIDPFTDNLSFLLQSASDARDLANQARRRGAASAAAPNLRSTPGAGRYATSIAGTHQAAEGVTVIGPIEKTSGLGQATRLSYQILQDKIAPSLSAIPFNVENPALIGFSTKIDFQPYVRPHRINLFHLNAESIPLAFSLLPGTTFENSFNIGYFFWELNKMPESHSLALDLLDEIWVSSEYVRSIYTSRTDKPVVNVGMAVEDLPPGLRPHPSFLQDEVFTFLTTFDSFSFAERKNPLAVVRAFQAAFHKEDREVALIIKTWNRSRVSDAYQVSVWLAIDDLVRDDPRVRIIDETFTYEQILSLKLACDCYVSLHRAEGFGFGMLEAMQLGRPVIATAYSGNMDFCTPENSYLVDYDLVPVAHDEYPAVERGSVWADPNLASAAAAMRQAVSNRDEAKERGLRAAQFVRSNFSIQAIADRYGRRLNEIDVRLRGQ
ncbi:MULTISPECIES: glycosyltransferase [unclassified Methylobacterium]|uniref:glycosyltransferase n=1 Tax=unclassified Methylobacterium TaxID=2615210 RepID=UPI0008F3A06F|nr:MULTISPECIES: glycosyltransferase [unclassified Methylobacterium]SFV01081.1 Glycosyltransferase involved in cell wall bisynthesis [Methylobacterium sp. UNCCL125]